MFYDIRNAFISNNVTLTEKYSIKLNPSSVFCMAHLMQTFHLMNEFEFHWSGSNRKILIVSYTSCSSLFFSSDPRWAGLDVFLLPLYATTCHSFFFLVSRFLFFVVWRFYFMICVRQSLGGDYTFAHKFVFAKIHTKVKWLLTLRSMGKKQWKNLTLWDKLCLKLKKCKLHTFGIQLTRKMLIPL